MQLLKFKNASTGSSRKKVLNIVFDVDGTLSGFEGCVTPELCHELAKKGAVLWMCSKRNSETEAEQIENDYGIKPLRLLEGFDYVSIKAQCLRSLKSKVGTPIVYVGDRLEDQFVADEAGVVYCSPEDLVLKILEHLHLL
jgi:phosphoglycolate phosphatase-like HAD superfamily hydrolase